MMPTYEITIPGSGTFSVESDRELTDAQAYQYALSQSGQAIPSENITTQKQQPELTVGRASQMLTRGMAVPALGAAGGMMVGGPPGALAGSLAVPAADLLAGLYNLAAPKGYELGYPSELVQKGLTSLGLPEPQTPTERALVAGGGALGVTGGQIGPLAQLAKTAKSPVTRGVAGQMAQQPVGQLAASVPAGAAAQAVGEKTENPLLAMLAGTLTAAPFMAFGGPKGQVPSSDKLKQEASALYRKSSAQGALIKPQSIQDAGTKILQEVSNKVAIDPEVDTEAMAVIRRLQKSFYQPQSLEQLDLTRQFLAQAKASGGRSGEFAGQALEKWDDYVNSLTVNDIANAKKPGVALKALQNARAAYAKSKKVETLEDLLSSAELRGEVNYTQAGLEQGIRQKLRALVENDKQMRYFTNTEQKMMRSVAEGGPIQNFLRWVGKASPTSLIGLSAGTYLAGTTLGPGYAAAVPVLGAGAKAASEALIMNRYNNLIRAIGGQPTVSPFARPAAIAARGAASAPPLGLLFPYEE